MCEGEALKWVTEFVYLGTRFSACGEKARDVKHRIAIGYQRFGSMFKIWHNEHADWKTKKQLYVTYIQSTVLHGPVRSMDNGRDNGEGAEQLQQQMYDEADGSVNSRGGDGSIT